MTLLITCWTSLERWTGSGSSGRIWAAARRGMRLLALHAVLRARLLAVADSGCVQRAPHHLVADARQVLDAAAADQDHGVLLKVVALPGDVCRHLNRAGDPHAGDLAQRGVRLLRSGGVDAGAHAAALRSGHLLLAALARLQARGGELLLGGRAALAHELGGGRHCD